MSKTNPTPDEAATATQNDADHGRHIGLFGATSIGVGAIVGGGILALAGVAFAAAGPSAIVAFAISGLVAFMTAASYAEISSAFPESGGSYTFAKKVLSVRAAFASGWVVWFAYIVAGVLYALSFASFAILGLQSAWHAFDAVPPEWFASRRMTLLLAVLPTGLYAISLARKSAGGGLAATWGKVVLFAVLIVAGVIAVIGQPIEHTTKNLEPFFAGGISGVIAAMGFTFIAVQGFDLIAAVAGEVSRPAHVIPRSMFYSLGLALLVYLPLLFVVSAAGVAPEDSLVEVAAARPEGIIPLAADRFMGAFGYWLVIAAGILSTLSALQANLFAASRVSLTMARDRTLPEVLGELHPSRGTPVVAIYASTLTLVAILFMVPDLASAGAAASLIFLLSFALTHVTTYLARVRGTASNATYRTPWFPFVPVAGGLACAGLGIFQAIVVPDAAGIVIIWLGLGVLLYLALFSKRAASVDAFAQALDPSLVRLRGGSPIVLVPIANPRHASAMVAVANSLVPSHVGRVLVLAIVSGDDNAPELPERLDSAQSVVRAALTTSYAGGHAPEGLITRANAAWPEIERVAKSRDCGSILIGLSKFGEGVNEVALENLINNVDCDVAVMRVPDDWTLEGVRHVLVPVGGRGEQHELRAQLLGSLLRRGNIEVTFLRTVKTTASRSELAAAKRATEALAGDKGRARTTAKVVVSDSVADAIVDAAADCDLVVMGLQSHRARRVGLGELSLPLSFESERAAFGPLVLEVASRVPCATILLSQES